MSTKNKRNHSNINFNQLIPPPTNNRPQNYRSQSQVGPMLTDGLDGARQQSRATMRYTNKISQVQRYYDVEINQYPQFQKNNQKYQEFLEKTKKFVKPYTDCTKYVDNLMKNKQLLRRGAFNLPTQPISVSSLGKTTNTFSNLTHQSNLTQYKNQNTFARSFKGSTHNHSKQLMKNSQTMQNIRKRGSVKADQKNGFDRTMQTQYNSYRKLLNEERGTKKQQVQFNNSMNRLLAAQMVGFRMLRSENGLRPTKSVKLCNKNV